MKTLKHYFYYYKFHLLFAAVLIFIVFSIGRSIFSLNSSYLYVATINIFGDLESDLKRGFISENREKEPVDIQLYSNLTLNSENVGTDYAVASEVKIQAAVDTKRLDIVFADKKALERLISLDCIDDFKNYEDFVEKLPKEYLTDFGNSEYKPFVLDVSNTSIFKNYSGKVYMCIISNSPRKERCLEYIDYIRNIR